MVSIKYVGYNVRIPIDLWEQIYIIANREWDPDERAKQERMCEPGTQPSPPLNATITKLLHKAMENYE